MTTMHKSRILLAFFLVFILFAQGCSKHEDIPFPREGRNPGMLSFVIEDDSPETVATRSRLTASDIETRKTSVTLAAYTEGILYSTQHYTSLLGAMSFQLEIGSTYDIYALVNMGDMSAAFPSSESDLSGMEYVIPGYLGADVTSGDPSAAIESRGLPMAGFMRLTLTGATSGTQTIPVKRLLAKVTATLNCQWGGTVTSAKVRNLNGRLSPFGGVLAHGSSKAVSASARLSIDELHGVFEAEITEAPVGVTATFYVPENMQGTVSGITSSSDKRPDGGNAEVSAKSEVLSYLETTVIGTGLYSGSITYRSYLGNNATSNFDIVRNTHYRWTVSFGYDGTQYDDWKHDNDLTETRYRLVMDPASASAAPGGTVQFRVLRYADTYHAGSLVSEGSAATAMSASDFTWTCSPASVATVASSGLATAVAAGSATVTATLRSGVSDYAQYANTSVSGTLDVNSVITYALVFSNPAGTTASSRKRLAVGYEKTLQVQLVTYADGVEASRTTLANADVSWSSSATAKATVSAAGVVKGISTGDVNITATYTPAGGETLTAVCYLTVVSGGGSWNDDWDDGGEVELDDDDSITGEPIIWD